MDVLALGSELKNTVCRLQSGRLHVSDVLGDLRDATVYRRFVSTVRTYARTMNERPNEDDPVVASNAIEDGGDPEVRADPAAGFVVACDLHPSYLSSQLAMKLGYPAIGIQHHYAHALSAMVDAGFEPPVIGVVCDGTGYGTDGASWGGEVLLCRSASFDRLAHLRYFALPGVDRSAVEIFRPALALLKQSFPLDWARLELPAWSGVDDRVRTVVTRQLEAGAPMPLSSSLGRMFDAVAFLTGVCGRNDSEGQAAMALESAAEGLSGRAYPYVIRRVGPDTELDWRPLIRDLIGDVRGGTDVGRISARFHATIIEMFARIVLMARERTGISDVVLSGGCMMNARLREGLSRHLREAGLTVGHHAAVPVGDAGLAIGQAVAAAGRWMAAHRADTTTRRRAVIASSREGRPRVAIDASAPVELAAPPAKPTDVDPCSGDDMPSEPAELESVTTGGTGERRGQMV